LASKGFSTAFDTVAVLNRTQLPSIGSHLCERDERQQSPPTVSSMILDFALVAKVRNVGATAASRGRDEWPVWADPGGFGRAFLRDAAPPLMAAKSPIRNLEIIAKRARNPKTALKA